MENRTKRPPDIARVSETGSLEARREKLTSQLSETEFAIAKLTDAFTRLTFLLNSIDTADMNDSVREGRRTEIQEALNKVTDEHLDLGERLNALETELKLLSDSHLDNFGITKIGEA